jgi:hypothetical protein
VGKSKRPVTINEWPGAVTIGIAHAASGLCQVWIALRRDDNSYRSRKAEQITEAS